MVFSKFNESYNIGGALLVYNHLSKNIVKVNSIKPTQCFEDSLFSEIDKYELQNRGFIYGENTDEELLAELAFYDYIYDNTLRLVLLPSENCNFRCEFCYERFSDSYMSKNTVDSLIYYLRKNITKFSGLSIDWFGGEPLLAKHIIEMFSQSAIQLCIKAKISYSASMTTNAFLLDAVTLEAMLNHKITNFHVTLCGFQEEHDAVRFLSNGGGTFQKIINNLLEIRNLVKRKSFKIVVRVNVTRGMLEKLEDFIVFLDDLFGGDERFTFYFRPVGDWGGKQVKNILHELNVNKEEVFAKVLSINNFLNFDIYLSLLSSNICAASKRNHFVVRANGDINKCTESLYDEYNLIGKLTDTGELNINKHALSRWLFHSEMGERCKKCVKYTLCRNRKCPDNNFKKYKAVSSYCGYDDLSIFEVLSLLNASNSKHIFKVTSI